MNAAMVRLFYGLFAIFCISSSSLAATIRLECLPDPAKKSHCEYIKERFEAENPPHKIEFVSFPAGSDAKLGILQPVFAAKDSEIVDVFQADTIWIGLLGRHLLDITDAVSDLKPYFFPHAWNNNTVNGRQKGIPAFLDAGVIYYRKDLLEKYGEHPPETWEELVRIAKKIQDGERAEGKENFWGYVFQGKAYEGLTCNALEWIYSYGGGTIVDEDGAITINTPQAAEALDRAASWIGTIASMGVLGYIEEESRIVFQNGDAAFMRNWPYAYGLTQRDDSPTKGKVGVIPVPKGGTHGKVASSLGGWQWVVSAYTKNPEAAIALLRIMASPEVEKVQFLSGFAPARMDVYDDPDIQTAAPWLREFLPAFESAVARPASAAKSQYPKVSKAVFNVVYSVLSGKMDGTSAVAEIETRLKKIKGKQWQ